eukprot:TRINITY_DN4412_c0_g2_i1.p1 TRINITY_DN4412_c0_g2~~TRINITY_DN4412_c0_g2_i1.p1  ORF type:complete len:496 (+),score=113.59 TRINITY_DN4412_c0_g2_i1:124-1488(+)
MSADTGEGCPVGALVCDVADLPRAFDAVRVRALARRRAVKPYDGRKAIHLTIEGAALLRSGKAPPEVQELLNEGRVHFVPGLRVGAQPYRGGGGAGAAGKAADAAALQADGKRGFRFIELFAGIGGFRRALEPLAGRCVFSSEIDVDCQEAYASNFGPGELYGDITEVPSDRIPEHDLLTAGFPCQPFSRRGEQQGFDDPRGELFYEITRALRAGQPAGFILENVWNMQFIDGGQWDKDESKWVYGAVYEQVMSCLRQAGYRVLSKQLSAEGWLPQKRERVYIVGFRDDLAEAAISRFQWPQPPAGGGGCVRDILEPAGSEEARACELSDVQWAAVQRSSTFRSGGEQLRFACLDGKAATLTASYRSSYETTAELVGPADAGLSRPRFFTRRECARLMGFPETHAFANANGPNRAYRQFGNAVCPPLIQAVARNLLLSLGLDHASDAGGATSGL